MGEVPLYAIGRGASRIAEALTINPTKEISTRNLIEISGNMIGLKLDAGCKQVMTTSMRAALSARRGVEMPLYTGPAPSPSAQAQSPTYTGFVPLIR